MTQEIKPHPLAAVSEPNLLDETFEAVDSLAAGAGSGPVYLVGFSLGGNFALRIARRYSDLGRSRLRGVFADWYDRHNDESDPNMRYVRIDVTSGFFHADGTGYEVDFSAKTAKVFSFAPDVYFLD